MRILHCCLAAFYIDDYGYQENILPKMHKAHGHDVMILASTETYIDNQKLGYLKPSSYFTKDNIPIIRLPYKKYLPHPLVKKLRLYVGIVKAIENFKPDIIFLHDCQFLSITKITNYVKKNPQVMVFVDSHTDFINSARSWISKNILHRFIYRYCAKNIEPYVLKFYGTLPVRNDFLINVYNIDPRKVELLPFGADDSLFDWNDKTCIRKKIRDQLNISEKDFVIITGGKIDIRKNIHLLLQAINEIKNEKSTPDIKVILFGKPNTDLKETIDKYTSDPDIFHMEWLPSNEIFNYFFAADLAVFPGTHSVLWEEAVGLGLPCIFQKWLGIQHLDLGGNCLFLNEGKNIEEIKESIVNLINNPSMFNEMVRIAESEGPKRFSYSQIAKHALMN